MPTQARFDVWAALSDTYDAPNPTREATPRQTTAMRAEIAAGGGVLAVANAWDAGADTPATRALFAPFGQIDDAAKTGVANMLLDRSAYSEELWSSATLGKPRPRKLVKA